MRINDVDEWIREVGSVIDRFYPTAAAKATGLPLADVFRQLIGLSQVGWLDLAYEVRCNQCNVTLKIERTLDPTSLYDQDVSCHICGSDLEVDADHVFPVFFVRSEWSANIKKDLAVGGRKVLPTGGESISVSTLSRENAISWGDFIFTSEEAASIGAALEVMPELKKLTTELQGSVPQNSFEKKNRLKTVKEVGETANVWADVVKKLGLVGLPYSPALKPAIEKVLALLGM